MKADRVLRGGVSFASALTLGLSIMIAGDSVGFAQPRQASTAETPTQPLHTAPVAYFAAHCQRCHGKLGSNYAEDFTNGKSDADLLKVLGDMATGPGGAPLKPEDLAAQVAFHRAIDTQTPFIAWTEDKTSGSAREIGGEASGTPTLIAKWSSGSQKVAVHEGRWTLNLPAGVRPTDVTLSAGDGKTRSELTLAKSPMSRIAGEKRQPPRSR